MNSWNPTDVPLHNKQYLYGNSYKLSMHGKSDQLQDSVVFVAASQFLPQQFSHTIRHAYKPVGNRNIPRQRQKVNNMALEQCVPWSKPHYLGLPS